MYRLIEIKLGNELEINQNKAYSRKVENALDYAYILPHFKGCYKRFEKLLRFEISERSVLGVVMGKSGPLKRARLANQYKGFRIPNR